MFFLLIGSALFLRILVSVPNEMTLHSHEMNVSRQIDRMQTIAKNKIIVIGGSGCGFGLCSAMIYEHFNMPVCNTGTHAGLGLQIQLNLCRRYICKGDIVVIIPEYENYLNNRYLGDVTALRILSTLYPSGYKDFSVKQQLHLVQFVPLSFQDAWSARKLTFDENDNGPYSRNALNQFGDCEGYEKRIHMQKQWKAGKWDNPQIQEKAIALLDTYSQYCLEQGATMLLFPPAYKAMCFDENEEFIDTIWNSLRDAKLPLAAYPDRYRFADTLFYDSEYHLIYEGVMLRTNRLIEDMDSALAAYGR